MIPMYDELIKRLRECTAEMNGEKTLWHQAADAIEELQVVVDGLTAQTNMVFEKTEGRTVIKFEPKWIPVTERLPEDYEQVLTCDERGNIHIFPHLRHFKYPFGIRPENPRYFMPKWWMPLPKAPESEDE